MRNNNKIVFSDVDVDSIVKYYRDEQLSCQKISSMFNCSENTIKRLLKKLGLLRNGTRDGKKIEFSDADVDKIIKYYCDEKLSCKEISFMFNCSNGTINKLLKKLGVLREGPRKIDFSDADVDKIVKYYRDEQLSCQEISYRFNCSKNTINKLLKKLGLLREGVTDGKKIHFSDVDIDNIIKYYRDEQLSSKEISSKFNCSKDTISNLLKKLGLLREGKKIEFSDSNVDNIIKYYCDEQLSCQKISFIFNCSTKPIYDLLKKRGLLRESIKIEFSDADVDKIITYYCDEQLSCKEISSMFNCSRETINKLLKKRGLIRTGVSIKRNGGVCKEYSVNGIVCHGSFEKYYIEFLNNNGLECPKNAEPISTPYGTYYPDFSFPNNLIEIKSDYTYDVLVGIKQNVWTKKFDTTQYKKIKWVNENVIPVKILVVDKKNNKIIEKYELS